jgi:hypothetical protein
MRLTNIIFLFGTLAGLIIIGITIATIATGQATMDNHSIVRGYAIMILALTMIFFGVKRYRDTDLGGVIKFLPAFLMGLAIAVVAGVIYVLGWEVYMAYTGGTFMDAFINHYIAGEKAKGLAGAELERMIAEMNAMKTEYNTNMPYRMSMTFMEIFPVGVIIALISAVLLRMPRFLPARG